MLKSYGIYNDVNKLPIFEKNLLSLPIDCDVAEIDTNDWSKWIIENYFSRYSRTEIICFLKPRKFYEIFFAGTVIWNIQSYVPKAKKTTKSAIKLLPCIIQRKLKSLCLREWIKVKRRNCWKEHLFYLQYIFC